VTHAIKILSKREYSIRD